MLAFCRQHLVDNADQVVYFDGLCYKVAASGFLAAQPVGIGGVGRLCNDSAVGPDGFYLPGNIKSVDVW